MVPSRYDWVGFVKWYENAISDCNVRNFINTSMKGACIHGAIVMPLREALLQYGKSGVSFMEILSRVKGTYSDQNAPDLYSFYDSLNNELDEIELIVRNDSRDESRKSKMIYGLLEKYEMINDKNKMLDCQIEGIGKLKRFLEKAQTTIT